MSTGKMIAKAAGFMMAATLISRALGYVRDVAIYSWFGQNYITDAYNAAFSVPDFIYMLLVGGALSSAFIPVFSSYLARQEEDEAWEVASILFNVTVVFLLALIALGLVYTRSLILLLVPKLPAESISLAVLLTRVMFIQTFFMAVNGIALGILNSRQHFTSPAVGAIFYNLGIIAVGLAMAHKWGIMAFSIGVVTGSVLNLAVQIPALLKSGIRYYPSFDLKNPGFRQIMILMLPVLIGLSVTQINLFVNQNLASGLAEGSISALRLAQRIMQLPIGIFGVPVAMAVFPAMTTMVAKKEMSDFKRTFSLGLRSVFLITIPAGVGMMALREPIVQLFFQQGKFDAGDTSATAMALFFYAIGLFAYSALQLLNRIFYSLKDTITPVVTGIVAIAANIALSMVFVRFMQHQGLALAYSVAGIINIVMLIGILKRRLGTIDGGKIFKSLGIAVLASGIMYLAASETTLLLKSVLDFAPKLNQLIMVVSGVGVGVVVYSAIILMFRLEETQLVMGLIRKRIPGFNFLG